MQREKDNEVEIRAALEQSKRAMRFGDTFGAVSALESVKQVHCMCNIGVGIMCSDSRVCSPKEVGTHCVWS